MPPMNPDSPSPPDGGEARPYGLRPTRLVAAMSALYGVGAFAVAGIAILQEVDEVVQGLVLWGTVWLLLSAPCAAAVAVVGWRAERALRNDRAGGGHNDRAGGTHGGGHGGTQRGARNPPPEPGAGLRRAWAWLVYAAGVVTAVHWLAMAPWTPALVVAAIFDPHDADEYLPLAAFGLVAWLLAAGGVILSVGGRRLLAIADGSAPPVRPARPATVPTSAVIAVVYAFAVTLPTVLWFAWLESAWQRGDGTPAVLGWVLLGIASAALAGGAAGSWLVVAAPVAPWTAGRAGLRQIEVSGGILAAHWVPTFVLVVASVGGQNPDLRYVSLILAFVGIVIGTAIWSSGRTWRVRPV
jgi:hypothetical protein